jgi:hypothetical protein
LTLGGLLIVGAYKIEIHNKIPNLAAKKNNKDNNYPSWIDNRQENVAEGRWR